MFRLFPLIKVTRKAIVLFKNNNLWLMALMALTKTFEANTAHLTEKVSDPW